jgi:DNA helicase-2/ATP-dependent DNA helicase PcrA
LRFFERAEIKNALAYLRLAYNREDDASFERIVNTPARGIGDRSIEMIRELARLHQQPLWQAARTLLGDNSLTTRSSNAIRAFIDLIDELTVETRNLELYEQMEQVIQNSGLTDFYKKEKGEKGRARLENLDELVSAARQFAYDYDENDMDIVSAFLSHAALEAGETQGDKSQDCVQMMTLHSAKGLEFPLVFLCGLEEGLFPHQMSIEEPGRLEEERRLCYVGITRAKNLLYLTHAESRRLYGSEDYSPPSRFISEIPEELVEEVRISGHHRPAPGRNIAPRQSNLVREPSASGFSLGQRVMHSKFGEGVILNYEGQGGSARVQVNFKQAGSKWLVVAYANLETA